EDILGQTFGYKSAIFFLINFKNDDWIHFYPPRSWLTSILKNGRYFHSNFDPEEACSVPIVPQADR
ncbi:hypothetical protein, partial [Limnospira platensis]|uniref:hypothetical protein n=1 Tax=Limnospira platensis TaxID=118562 RepID=UPI00396CA81C